MRTESSCYSVVEMCLALGVSRSGLYDHSQKHQGQRRQQDEELAEQIALIFLESRQTYGSRRIRQILRRRGIYCGKNRICRLMEGQGLRALQKRRFRPKTTQSSHAEPIVPNRLNQLPEAPGAPNQVWCADITYLPTLEEGWLYLAAEMDLCSKRIAGWKLDDSLAAPLVVEAFQRAVSSWSAPALHHTDRGVQYASAQYTEILHQHQAQISMSRKGNPYDNAACESFIKTLKYEEVYRNEYRDFQEARSRIGEFLEDVYNQARLHSALGYCPPAEFEKKAVR